MVKLKKVIYLWPQNFSMAEQKFENHAFGASTHS